MSFILNIGFFVFLLVLIVLIRKYNRVDFFVDDDLDIHKINDQHKCLDKCKNSYIFWLNSKQHIDYRDCINNCFI
uniref:Uncharacterized protein n=1 Tax=viral metagenome TaxID=1070528 RepID=A0A6C0ACL6_9ZZZZ